MLEQQLCQMDRPGPSQKQPFHTIMTIGYNFISLKALAIITHGLFLFIRRIRAELVLCIGMAGKALRCQFQVARRCRAQNGNAAKIRLFPIIRQFGYRNAHALQQGPDGILFPMRSKARQQS